MRSEKGHSSAVKQGALLEYVPNLIGENVAVHLTGDSEFGSLELIDHLEWWNWSYALREKSSTQVYLPEQGWRTCGELIDSPGQKVWLPGVFLTMTHIHAVNLLVYWKPGESEPWILATDFATAGETIRAYKRRMWIEEMFGDLKGKGFDLESTHLRHVMRLSRLTLIVALLYVWLFSTGAAVIKKGKRHLVDRHDRRDLSVFQIGYRFILRLLANEMPVKIILKPGAL